MSISSYTRSLAILLTLALTGSLSARADDASHRAKAIEMMAILHTQRLVQNVSDNIKKQVADAADKIAGPTASDASKAKVTDFEKKANQIIDSQLSWESMQPGFADIYVKNFTEEQLDGIIAFYKTPAGAALLENMPTVNNQVTQFGNSRTSALQPQLKQLFDDFQKSEATPSPILTPAAPASAPPVVSRPAPSLGPAPSSTPK